MEQTPDKSKPPPPTSYRETFRRRRKLFCVPIVLGVLAAAFFVFTSSKTYTSTADLWVDTAPPLASSVGAGLTAPLTEPPAAAEQGILGELLTTQAFATSVAKNSLLGKYLGNAAAIRKQAPELLEAGQVVPLVTGQQILKVVYTGPTAAITESVLAGIVTQLRQYNDGLSAQHDQAAVAYDTEQVKLAQTALNTARSNVIAYLGQHPGGSQTDPNYLALGAAESNAQTALSQANATLSQATATRDAGGWSIQVVDPPSQAVSPALGKKKMLEVILGGAFGGLLVSFLAVVALTPAKKEPWEDELPLGQPLAPDRPPAGAFHTPPSAPTAFGQHRPRLSTGERRFSFRSGSEQVDDR